MTLRQSTHCQVQKVRREVLYLKNTQLFISHPSIKINKYFIVLLTSHPRDFHTNIEPTSVQTSASYLHNICQMYLLY